MYKCGHTTSKSEGDSMKKWLGIISIGILVVTVGTIIGYFVFFYSNTSKNKIDDTKELASSDEESSYENNLELVVTSYSGIKISPNTYFSYETYYKECNHKEVKEERADESLVNLNEKELQEKYSDWTIKQFGTEKVVLYKEVEGYCDEHYVLREKDGCIGVFKVNNNGEEELIRVTNILVQYLPETDIVHIKEGLEVYSKDSLNKILEDFE